MAEDLQWYSGLYGHIMFLVITLLLAWVVFKMVVVLQPIVRVRSQSDSKSRSSSNLKAPLRLHAYFCETTSLDEVGINEVYNLFKDDFIGASGYTNSAQYIHKVVLLYSHIAMCRDRRDGTLRGCMLVNISHKTNYTQIEIGRTIFKTHYRGSPFLKIILSNFVLGEIVRHPWTPIYVIGDVVSYKAYLVGVSMNLMEYHPVYNKETPEHFKKMFAEYAASFVSTKGNQVKYNPETFIIEQKEISLGEESLSTVTERDLQNPHIKFFVERNPGWRKGHCLLVGFHVTWMGILWSLVSIVKKMLSIKGKQWKVEEDHVSRTTDVQKGKRQKVEEDHLSRTANTQKSKGKRPPPPLQLRKRFSFQDMSANTYLVNSLEYDMMGEAMLSASSKAVFAFQEESEVNSPTDFNVNLPSLS